MGHHIDAEGRFQSDKYPALGPDKVVISLKDPRTHTGLLLIANNYKNKDAEFADDLSRRVHELAQPHRSAAIDWGRVREILKRGPVLRAGCPVPYFTEGEVRILNRAQSVDPDRLREEHELAMEGR
jgi:hypothetical protein